ncbi:hypothetical protein [Maribacter luteus]|uniref:hypothetical protein n=1 Tax=Maribacter luteus TaxID=2594478 RepID=UPI002492B670|nr:hypothetical protein [Maribacter luteus]
MNQKTNHKTKMGIPALTPLIGIGVFVICYVLATLNYPGGNWSSPDHESFSIWHNYLCDLLDSQAINGEENSARPYAISALLALCLGLFTLWIRLPALFIRKSPNLRVMKVSGLLALATIFFLALGSHDTIVRIAGFFGVIAFTSTLIELFKAGYGKIFFLGLICLFVFLTNYFIYESGRYISWLPVIQKITFVLYIIWFIGLDLMLYRTPKYMAKNNRSY